MTVTYDSDKPVPQPNAKDTSISYAKDVLEGRVVACRLVKLACQRFLDDLVHGGERGLRMDWAAAQHCVNFFGFLRHTKGVWARKIETSGFVLAPWQIFILTNLFGFKYIESGLRRYREALIEVARKNGKSTFIAGIGLYMFMADKEPGAEVYSAATTKDQAKIVFNACVEMVRASKAFAGRVEVLGNKNPNTMLVLATNSKFAPLAADAETLDGLNIHCALIDELHEHPTRKLYDVLNTATGSRSQPGIYSITTAGSNKETIWWEQREYSLRILQGIVQDDKFFVFIATLDEGDNWEDEAVWGKPNPNLGVSVSIEALRPNAQKAKEQPPALFEFLRKHMNVYTPANTAWLQAGAWDKNTASPEHCDIRQLRLDALEKLKGRRCFGGLDLSECEDNCAFVLVFPPCEKRVKKEKVLDPKSIVVMMRATGQKRMLPLAAGEQLLRNGSATRCPDKPLVEMDVVMQEESERTVILPFFWIPSAFIEQKEKKNRANYRAWIQQGFITPCPGNVIDQEMIRNKILELKQTYNLMEMGFDPYGAEWIAPKLESDGVKITKVPPFMKAISQPTKVLSNLINAGLCEHYRNPVLRWHADNVEMDTDAEGSMKPDKGMSRNKIDGVSAAVIAMSRALANPDAAKQDAADRFNVRYL